MNMRQDAKAGLDMMNRMGQMGNSDQATLPDNIPFQPKNFQQGGVNIQNPQVQQPQIIPDVQQQNQVPGVTFTQPTAPMVRPSIYSQKPMMPNVNVPPKVDIPKQTTYKPPQYKTPTGTAATPDFSKLIGTRFGQLQKTETKKYVNSETGEELFIPFVDGQPVYPIPDGFVFEKDVEKEKAKEKPTEAIKTTRVTGQDSDSGDDNTFTDTTFVRPERGGVDDVTSELSPFGPGLDSALSKGLFKLDDKGNIKKTPLGIVNDFKNTLVEGFKSPMSFIGNLFAPAESKEITSEEQTKRAQSLGFGYDDLLKNLGLENNKTNLSVGHNAGSVSPFDNNAIYNSKGLLVNMNKSDVFNFGGSKRDNNGTPIRATTQGFRQDLVDMYKSGWAGGYTGLGASATLSNEARVKENAYRNLTGMPELPSKTEALKALAGFNTGYNLDPNRDKGKDIYVRDNGGGVITGGEWKTVNGNLQYVREPGRGTIIAGKGGKVGVFPTRNIGKTSIIKDPKVIGTEVKLTKEDKKPKIVDPTFQFVPDTQTESRPTPSVDLAPAGADYSGSLELASQYADDPSSVQGDPSGGFGETGTTSEPGGFSSTGDFGFTAEGGFISRRRATKIKKKQGGLASRK